MVLFAWAAVDGWAAVGWAAAVPSVPMQRWASCPVIRLARRAKAARAWDWGLAARPLPPRGVRGLQADLTATAQASAPLAASLAASLAAPLAVSLAASLAAPLAVSPAVFSPVGVALLTPASLGTIHLALAAVAPYVRQSWLVSQ